MIFRMGWRNLFRNRRRTLLTAGAIALGLAGLMFTDALILGMIDNLVASATGTFLGEGQIHAEGFRDRLDAAMTVKGYPGIADRLKTDPDVEAFAPRTMATAMLSSASEVLPAVLCGIDPAAETRIQRLKRAVIRGSYLDALEGKKVLVGEKAAELLGIDVGDRVVVTTTRVPDGELMQELFRVGGVFRFGSKEMDEGFCFAPLETAQDLLGLPGGVHEVAVKFKGRLARTGDLAFFTRRYGGGGNEAKGWMQLLPALKSALEMTKFSSLIVALILMIVVSLAIMNTLFMSLYERTFEFAVLKALGTRPGTLGALILAEAGALAAMSVVFGVVLGTLINLVLMWTGIDYSGIEFAGVIMDKIRPVFGPLQYTFFPAGVVVFTLLVAIYPAWHAANRMPAAALKKTL